MWTPAATSRPWPRSGRAAHPPPLVFVPLADAVVGPGHVKVDYDKSLVKKCPATSTADVLLAEDEAAVFAHYGLGLPFQPGASGERQLARR